MRFGSRLLTIAALMLGLALACRFTEVSSPQPVPTAVPEVNACQIPPGQPGLPGLQAGEMLDYLNRGGSLATLSSFLESSGQLAHPFVLLDIDGNQLEDLIVSMIGEQSGSVQIYLCSDDAYRLAYISAPSMPPGTLTVHSTDDLNGDELPDLLITRDECGAHTCTALVEALIWHDGRLDNRFRGDTSDLPSPQLAVNRSGDQRAEIQITATGIGSVGAGPYRMQARSWTWDDAQTAFVAGRDELLASNFRIHFVHDADDAAAAGNYDAALAYYQQVIDDPELDDWLAGEAGHASLAAYAQFRRMMTILQLGDLGSAEQALAGLLQAHPESVDGHGFAAMGEEFWSALSSGLDDSGSLNSEAMALGCQAAQAYAITHREETLDRLYYGYANRTYGPESICPLES